MAKSEKSPDLSSLSFEAALTELEEIVRQLETGKSSLEDAIGAYERGARLKQHCEKKLTEAKARVEKITLGSRGAEGLEPADLEQG
jgi:exodeoxyribonuclease VII small subunit